MDNKSIFAKNLNYYMAQNGKTRRDVCQALGFSYYTFSDWCNGKKYPRMDKVEMLADYFGVLKSDLIEEKVEKKEKPTEDDGLSDSMRSLVEFAKTVPEEKADMILKVIQSILEDYDGHSSNARNSER